MAERQWLPTPACQTLEDSIEALTGFSHVYHSGVLNTTSPTQGCDLGTASGIRKGQPNPHSKDREGVGSL